MNHLIDVYEQVQENQVEEHAIVNFLSEENLNKGKKMFFLNMIFDYFTG
jgi:hypothetical protein